LRFIAWFYFTVLYCSEKFTNQLLIFDHSRHVILPVAVFEKIPKGRLLRESEWRAVGVGQGPGWVHFMLHKPGKNLFELVTLAK